MALVALRKESVDRNYLRGSHPPWLYSVALRKESVDRNILENVLAAVREKSLSARRAWIEMP